MDENAAGADENANNPNIAPQEESISNNNTSNNVVNSPPAVVNFQAPPAQPQNTNIRDRLFHLIFVRATIAYSRLVPEHLRRIVEFFLLLKALFFLFILLYVHVAFSRLAPSCLSDLKTFNPKDGVFRLQVFTNDRQEEFLDGEREKAAPNSKIPILVNVTTNNRLIILNVDPAKFLNDNNLMIIDEEHSNEQKYQLIRFLLPNRTDRATGTILIDKEESMIHEDLDNETIFYNETVEIQEQTLEHEPHQFRYSFLSFLMKDVLGFDPFFQQDLYIFEYAQELGYLHLSENARKKLKIPVVIAQLDPETDQCFGNGFNRLLIQEFLGYDEILISSIKGLVENDKNKGFVKNLATGQKYRFVNSTIWSATYFWSFLAMIIFTFGITMLLRFSHHLILTFIFSFLRTLEMREPLEIPAAPFLTIILALVGLEAIMSETFSDTGTAFYVILIVWMADQYDAICCRSPISKRHWPRFFYLYHFAFYAYYFRFSGQYGGLALLTSWCFIQHSMVFFFHHYDLPLVLHDQHIRRLFTNLENNARVVVEEISTNTDNEQGVGYSPVPPVNLINRNRRYMTEDGRDTTSNSD